MWCNCRNRLVSRLGGTWQALKKWKETNSVVVSGRYSFRRKHLRPQYSSRGIGGGVPGWGHHFSNGRSTWHARNGIKILLCHVLAWLNPDSQPCSHYLCGNRWRENPWTLRLRVQLRRTNSRTLARKRRQKHKIRRRFDVRNTVGFGQICWIFIRVS